MASRKPDPIYENIFSSVAKRISPTKEEAEKEKAFAEGIKAKLQRAFGSRATLFFVGSTARDTGIRGDRDIDIFVAFPKEKSKDAIVRETVSTVKRVLPASWEMHYAEHPYLQGRLAGYKLEIVPCFKIEVNEGIISAVDRTPLHAQYLQKHLTEKQKRDVRVLKALLKAHGIYGAELEVGGFSGLVCEYLVLNYRSLRNLLQEASKWKPPVILDIEDYYDQEFGQLKKRFTTPLIIMDFIDRNRNAAAAITLRSFALFIALSRSFLNSPSDAFFIREKREYSPKALEDCLKERNILLIRLARPKNLVSDILVPQLRRCEASVVKQLHLAEYKTLNSLSFSGTGHCFILLELEHLTNYPIQKIRGPPVYFASDVAGFLSAHKHAKRGPFLEEDRVVIEEGRKDGYALSVLARVRKSPTSSGIASHFIPAFKAMTLLEKDSLLYELRKNTELRDSLADFIFSKENIR